MRMIAAIAAMFAASACAMQPPEPGGDTFLFAEAAHAIEKRSGGRLGVAVTDAKGTLLFGTRANERFAMCSTFKLLLAGQVLERATAGVSLRTPLSFSRADMVPHSPGTEKLIGPNGRGEQRLGFAARDAVVLGDNMAANLMLNQMGGPEIFTAALRLAGDDVTRLDRNEPDLNENAPGDARDTTSPLAMAKSASAYVFGDRLHPTYRQQLRGWLIESETGRARIRAGLPADWVAGDKTGSCDTAYNDVAFVESPARRQYMITIYLDRPTIDGGAANAIIADVARLVVEDLQRY